MTRLRALLLVVISSSMGALLATSAPAAVPGRIRTQGLGPVATIARTGASHNRAKHAHASCKAKRKHGRKHRHSCPAHKVRAKGSHRAQGRARSQGHKPASLAPKRALHAQGASNQPKRPSSPTEATSVTVDASASTTIASVLATPCQNTELMPTTDNLEQIESATVCLVNQERARSGELPLHINAQLAQAAQRHSEAMVEEDYFAHIAPNGETPLQRVRSTGYIPNSQVGYTLGENIAWGTLGLATPGSIVAAWIASPEHLTNILDKAYRETAVGVEAAAPPSLAEGQPGAIYTQEFGVIEN